MWLETLRRRWFGNSKASRKTRKGRPARPIRLRLEALEDRTLPSTIPVTIFTDSNVAGAGSLRDAILQANADSGTATDIIQLQAGTYSLTLQSSGGRANNAQTGALNITNTAHTLIIEGQGSTGANATIINASQLNDRVFQVGSGVTVEFQNLEIEGGLAQDDGATGATLGSTDAQGGGILNQGGYVSLTNVAVQSNQAVGSNGHNGQGGGVFTSFGTLTLSNATVSHNTARGASGVTGAVNTHGRTGGTGGAGANGQGGGLFNEGGAISLNSVTFADNVAQGGGGGRGGNAVLAISGQGFEAGVGGVGGIGGGGDGGGLYAYTGTLSLSSVTFTGDTAQGGGGGGGGGAQTSGNGGQGGQAEGGALSVAYAQANLNHDMFSGDVAQGGAGGQGGENADGVQAGAGGLGGSAVGGGLFGGSSTIVVIAGTFSNDTAQGGGGGQGSAAFSAFGMGGRGGAGGTGGSGYGGGAYSTTGTLSLSSVAFTGDTAQGGGGGGGGTGEGQGGQGGVGGLAQGGALGSADFTDILAGTTFSGNAARGGAGGEGGGSESSSGVGGNGGGAQGGAVGTATNIVNSGDDSFLSNIAAGGNGGQGGIGLNTGVANLGGAGGTAQGGGLFVANGTVTSTNDVLSGNSAQGAAGGHGGTGRVGGSGGNGGNGQGGGLFAAAGTIALTSDTLTSNSAQGGAGALAGFGFGFGLESGNAGNGGAGQGGGVSGDGGTVSLTDDTLSNNTAKGAAGASGPSEPIEGGISFAGNGGTGQGGGVAALGSMFALVGDTLSGNMVQGGNGGQGAQASQGGGAAGSAGGGQGGGVFAGSSTVSITGVTLAGNSAHGGSGGSAGNGSHEGGYAGSAGSGQGGGVSGAGATLFLTNDTIVGNSVVGGNGGHGGSAFSASGFGMPGAAGGNGQGGGISVSAGALTLTNDTIAGNSTTAGTGGGGGFGNALSGTTGPAGSSQGGGFQNGGATSVTLQNSLIAQNTATTGPDYAGSVTTSDHNLIGNSSGSSGFSTASGDILNPASVGLGTLANNGGPTQTLALLAGSSAIGAADAKVAPVSDERGVSRTVNTPPDIGAYQTQAFATVPTSRMIAPSTFTDSASSTSGSLRAAVIASNNDTGSTPITIQLASGTYNLTVKNTAGQENGAQQGDLDITNPAHTLIIQGHGTTGANATIIDAAQLDDRVFQVGSGVTVEFQDLVIEGGLAQDNGAAGSMPHSSDALGGGLLNQGGNVSLTNVVVRSNQAQAGKGHNALGGGVYTSAGTLHVTQSIFSGNVAQGGTGLTGGVTSQGLVGGEGGSGATGAGAGLYAASGSVTLTGDTFSGNNAQGGLGGRGGFGSRGGVGGFGGVGAGGAIDEANALLMLIGDTLTGNTASGGQGGQAGVGTFASGSAGAGGFASGGGLYTGGGVVNLINDTLFMNTIQANNRHSLQSQGGAIDANAGIVLLTNDTIANNVALANTTGGTGGGVQNVSAFVSLQNTLIAQNTAGTGPDYDGTVQVSDHNLIGNSSGSNGFSAANGDILNPASVGLGTLANNGGPTQTLALQAGSPAINAGDDAALATIAEAEGVTVANATDQTGHARLSGSHIDIGSVEFPFVATKLQFVQPSTFTAGQAGTLQVEVLDQFGNVLTSDNSDQVTLSGALFVSGTTTATVQKGIATFSNLILDKAGSYTLTATSGSLTQAQTLLTVSPAATSHLVVGGLWQASSSAGQTTFDGQGLTFTGTNTVALPNGLINGATSLTVTITFQTTAGGVLLGYQDQPVGTVPTNYVPALYVGTDGKLYAEIWNGTINPIQSTTLVNDGKQHTAVLTLSGTTQTLKLDGVVVGTRTGAVQPLDMVYDQLGYGDTTLWPAGNGSFDPFVGTVNKVFVSSGTPSSTSTVLDTAGVAGTVTVVAEDAFGNVTPGYNGTVHFTSNDPKAVLPANATLTNGVGTFSVTLDTAGGHSVTATDTAHASITGSETGISVTPAATSKLVLTGFPASTTAGVAHTVTVTAEDAFGNVATGYTGTVHFTSSDPKAVLPANVTLTTGVGTFSLTLDTAGTQSITATDTNQASITGSESNITVHPAAATHFIVSGFPSSVTAGVASSITVTAEDAFGNVATGYTGTIHFSSSDPKAVLPANTMLPGMTTFGNVILETAGTQSITVTDTTTPSITGTESGITVKPAAPTQLVVSGFPASTTAGVAGNVTVTEEDAFGNVSPNFSTTAVQFSSSDPKAVLPPFGTLTNGTGSFSVTLETAGTKTITATETVTISSPTNVGPPMTYSISGSESGITVTPAAPASLTFLTEPSNVTAGQAITPSVKVELLDAFGNVATNSSAAVTLALASNPGGGTLGGTTTVNAVNGVATFSNLTLTAAGNNYQLKATEGALLADSTTFNVAAAAPAGVDIHGQPSDGVVGQAISPAITVAVVDAYGNTVTNSDQAVTLAIFSGPAGAKLGGTTRLDAVNGVATFGNLTLNEAGSYVLTATGGRLTPDFSNSFTVTPADVSADVSIQRGHLHPAGHGQPNVYEQILTLTNISGGPLNGPLAVVLSGLPSNVVVDNATGSYQGNPYLDVLPVSMHLAAGQSLTVTLQFSFVGPHQRHDRDPSYSTDVLEGI